MSTRAQKWSTKQMVFDTSYGHESSQDVFCGEEGGGGDEGVCMV